MNQYKKWIEKCFPRRRLDPDFPLPIWFAGLWFYLKSFLYLCYVYMLGIEPPPYPTGAIVEIFYFGVTMIPAFLLGFAMWNEKERFYVLAIIFLAVDTPLLFFHVARLAYAGFLDSGLTQFLEFGSLFLNVAALAWMISYTLARKSRQQETAARRK